MVLPFLMMLVPAQVERAPRIVWTKAGTFLQRREGEPYSRLTVSIDLGALRRAVGGMAGVDQEALIQRIDEAFITRKVPVRVRQVMLQEAGPKARRDLLTAALRRGDPSLDLDHPICRDFLSFWSRPMEVGSEIRVDYLDAQHMRAQGPHGAWATDQDPGIGTAMLRANIRQKALDPAFSKAFLIRVLELLNPPAPDRDSSRAR